MISWPWAQIGQRGSHQRRKPRRLRRRPFAGHAEPNANPGLGWQGKADADRQQVLQQAWIGDAALALYARLRILAQDGGIDGPKAERMTGNQFLAALAEPSEAEARMGRVYAAEGREAAFVWIETHLMPIFERQEAKRGNKSVRSIGESLLYETS